MSIVADCLMVLGGSVAVVAALGLLRFASPYARFHAAGKASPVAFLITAAGAAIELGWLGAVQLSLAAGAMVLTLPVGVHLLFLAVHRSSNHAGLVVDELASVEREAFGPRPADRSIDQRRL